MIPEATIRDYQKLSMSLLYKMAKRIPGWLLLEQKDGKQVYYSRDLVKEELRRRNQKIRSRWLGEETE